MYSSKDVMARLFMTLPYNTDEFDRKVLDPISDLIYSKFDYTIE